MLYTGDDVEGQTHNCWAIDATPIEINNRLYLVWSGWPDGHDVQYLYIARMENPWTVTTKRVRLCTNDTHLWERVGETEAGRGLHEGPQALIRNGRVFIVYSCSASWEPTYKLGMIWMDEQADPLDPQSWKKHDRPVFQGTDDVLGVGHASFTRSPDDSEDWIVYHTKVSTRPGWERAVHIQRFTWTADGLPDFGSPISAGRIVEAPRGEPGNQPGISFFDAFDQQTRDKWAYYGFNRYIWVQDGRLSLGGRPTWGLVNNYRSGEKALVRGFDWSDLTASVKLQVVGGNRQAGLCFRIQQPAVGYNAYRGYFAAIVPGERKIVLGKADGSRWHELASAEHPMATDQWYTLKVEAVGDRLQVFLNNEKKIEVQDADYGRGMAGVRVVDTHALFDEFVVHAHPNVIPGPAHLTEAPVQPPAAESAAQAHPPGSPAQVAPPAAGSFQAQATATTAPASPDQPQVHIENAVLKGAPPAPTRISDSPNK
jgi:hypothetical protein